MKDFILIYQFFFNIASLLLIFYFNEKSTYKKK